jgi:very-short-patch-repair endonuclease
VIEAVDAAIAAVAARQHGQIARCQLRELGLSKKAIAHRVERGRLIPSFPSVFSVGHPPTTVLAWASAAVLACSPGAVLSHDSAAVLWDMLPRWQRPFHVTASSNRHIEGITVHRSTLSPEDITRQQGIPCTTPARTALDLAPRLTPKALARAVNQARLAGYLHAATLEDLVESSKGHRGIRALRPVATQGRTQEPTRSDLERDFLAFAERYGLPTPKVNVVVAGHLVDAYFPEHKLVVEVDSWRFHQDRASFENDRDRDADLLAIDHATVRITWERFTTKPRREATRLEKILRQRVSPR